MLARTKEAHMCTHVHMCAFFVCASMLHTCRATKRCWSDLFALAPQAFAQTARLFPGCDNDDNSWKASEVDDSAPEKSADFSSATTTNMGSETGIVTSKSAEEKDEVEEQLVVAVVATVAHTQSSGVVPAV